MGSSIAWLTGKPEAPVVRHRYGNPVGKIILLECHIVRLIKKLKAEGYLHKDIRKALNNKVSMTTISDIVNNKRYSNIK